MSFQLVLLIGLPNGPLIEALRQELNQESLIQAIEFENFIDAKESLPLLLPDLILIYSTHFDEQIQQFCQDIRSQASEHRPVLVISSETANKDERIHYFLNGADDYLNASIEPEEFAVRILVHLRRNVELLSHSKTGLPGLNIFSRLIQRHINMALPWALLVIELNHFDRYTEVYGSIPSEQILKTMAALLKSSVYSPDIVGQTDYQTFLVLTTPDKAEKIAERLCKQFDDVVPHFYSEKDQHRGYLISLVNEQVSQRVPFVCLSIGIATSENRFFKTYMSAYNAAINMKNLAKNAYSSHWLSERMRLTGQIIEPPAMKKILLVEGDAALAFLLKSTLEMQHYQVETALSYDEAKACLSESTVDLMLMDPTLHGQDHGWELCRWIRQQITFRSMGIICISSVHEREAALSAGADLYLPKPFELSSLFTWVEHFLKR